MYSSVSLIQICFILLQAFCNCLGYAQEGLPIDTTFNLPSPLPAWPPGDGFATGSINLGGLLVRRITSFELVWASYEGGEDNLGASFFQPASIPQGFHILGFYSQPNNRHLSGWVLVGKDETGHASDGALRNPIDYTLLWSSQSLHIKQHGVGYIWLPVPPEGYRALGYVVTNTPEKPATDRIQCVQADLTDKCETDKWIWGTSDWSVHSIRPSNRSVQAQGVSPGTFSVQNGGMASELPVACLKSINTNLTYYMPNLRQIESLVEAYSPLVYFHPDEPYLTSSVDWFFTNGALLYKKGEELHPVSIEPNGSNLPQGGANDDAYWLDLPTDKGAKERVKTGDLHSAKAYMHIKPMLGTTFTDITIWLFYPFNGAARAKIKFVNVNLGRIGEHVSDWEHVTLRVSNFDGVLDSIYVSEHSGGIWLKASQLEFEKGNKVVIYSSLHGHAFSAMPGLYLQGNGGVGIRNDFAKSEKVIDTGINFSLLAADYNVPRIAQPPPWLNYFRKWGPTVDYDIAKEIKKVKKLLFLGELKSDFQKFVDGLPDDVLREAGPLGPKMKASWSGDEV